MYDNPGSVSPVREGLNNCNLGDYLSNPITQTRISDINDTVEIKSTKNVLNIPIRDGTSIPCIAGIPQYLGITLQTLKLVGSTLRG